MNEKFHKKFVREVSQSPAVFALYMYRAQARYTGATPGNSQGRTGQERTTTATGPPGNNRRGKPAAAESGQISPAWRAVEENKGPTALSLSGRPMPGEHSHPCLLRGRSTAGGLANKWSALSTACVCSRYNMNYALKCAMKPRYWPATWWKLVICCQTWWNDFGLTDAQKQLGIVNALLNTPWPWGLL